MFLSKGFNGFISKPVDIFQLDEALNKYVRDKRKEGTGDYSSNNDTPFPTPHSPFPNIPGLDVKKGIFMTGGTEEGYRIVLATLCKNVEERMTIFQTVPDKDTLLMFITQVHSLKSSAASIGAAELSDKAAKLEAAGRAEDLAYIREHLSDFSEHLTVLVKNIGIALNTVSGQNDVQDLPTDKDQETDISTIRLFRELTESLKSRKIPEIKRVLNVLNRHTVNSKAREILQRVSDQVLMAEFDDAVNTVEEFVADNKKE